MQPNDRPNPGSGPHLTEGDLHAFLDGALAVHEPGRARQIRAHVESCTQCRDRLAIESSLRDRADTLLAADDPLDAVVLPTFDELRHQAGARSTGVATRRGLAWAATVVLSLGVGYGVGVWGPGGVRPEAIPVEAVAADESPAVTGRSATSARTTEPVAIVPERASPAPADVEAEAEAPVSSAPLDAAASARPRVAIGALDSLAVRGADSVAFRAIGGGAAAVAGVPARIDSLVAADPVLRGQRTMAPPRAANRPPARIATERPAVRDRSALDDALRVPVAGVMRLAEPAVAGTAAGTEGTEGEGGVPVGLALPGFTTDEVRWTEVWPGQEGVLVTQHGSAATVELRAVGAPVGSAVAAAAPPPARPGARSGWARAVRRVEGGWLVLDGPLPLETLTELLATLR